MEPLLFEWDPKKATLNQLKHHVSFTEAKSVFYDDNALLINDPEHSLGEHRFVILGTSKSLRLIIVCHCYRKGDSVIRIISARRATKHESKQYKESLK